MATLRGQDGLLVLGGYVIGTPHVAGAVAPSGTTVTIAGSPLVGVSGPGDTFVVNSNTYTVTGTWHVASGNQITGITFTPGAIGGFTDLAAVTYNLNSIAQVREWTLTATLASLETTVLRQAWRTYRSGLASFTGGGEALLDYGDAQQKALIDKVLTATPDGTTASLLFGLQDGFPRVFYAAALLTELMIQQSLTTLVSARFTWQSQGALSVLYI